MATNTLNTLGRNITFPIYNADGTSFHGLEMKKSTVESIVMSLGDKITGDVYYKDNNLAVTMQEYIEYKRNPDDENEVPVRFVLVNPPTIVREGMASDNGELKGMTKYSFEFYHPMCMLANFPFTDVAVESGQGRYLSESKTFSWTGTGFDFIAKINKNLQGTEWVVVPSKNVQSRANLSLLPDKVIHVKSEEKEQSMVLSFDKNFVSDALKTAYDTWEVPFVIDALRQGEYTYTDAHNNVIDYYDEGKRFVVVFGLPNDEILDSNDTPYVFRYGQGVGLKNNSRTPKNNKIITRIVGYGSQDNIPYGYPQIVWNGADDDPRLQYPIYKGIVGGQYVKLIKHPFTRKTLMPSIYAETVNKKVNPDAVGYDPDIEIKDYYDADNTYDNPINVNSPSVAIHQFDIKPRLGQKAIVGVSAYDEKKADYITEADFRAFINTTVPTRSALTQLHVGEMMDAYDLGESDKRGFVGGSQTYEWELAFDGDFCSVFYNSPDFYYNALVLVAGGSPEIEWDDTMNDDGEYVQSYFKLTLPNTLDFDLYACAAITQEMKINMRSGDCIGCTFNVQVDWDDYKKNFYDADGNFDPVIGEGHPRNAEKYPNSYHNSITLVVQKDIETFGRIMPNTYQQPKVGDEFVILGISLPLSYITNAQVELDNAMKDYMMGNNVYYYEYPLKFDEHFLATHTNILAQIRNNVKLRFGYGNDVLTLYVKQMSVKYGNSPLPQYDITLTDDVEVVMNAIGQMAEYAGRTRMQLDELQRTYGDDIVQRINEKLSRVADDIAEGRITFQHGLVAIGNVIFNDELRSPDFESGLYSGKGWRIDKLGNAEMESLRVRSYLEVVELLINRLQAQEGDTVFTDNDQIEHVEEKEYNNTTYYVLSLKEKWEGYITSQQKDNILKGIINTLAANYGNVSDITEEQCVETDGINKYYTSWMKVIDASDVGETLGRNQIAVILYEDTDTPANKNFPPCELMTVARCGCDADPDDETLTDGERQSIIRRQSVFSISTSDGRIAKLRGVRTPIMQNVNYGTTLGTIPDFIKQWSVYSRLNKNRDYLYAQGVIVSDFIKVDSVGDPITNYVDAGQWQDNTPYLHNAYNEQNAQWETNDVWHDGAYWRCLVTQPYNGVYYEPTDANNLYWQKLLTSGQNGTPAPFYTEEWYAWSNDASTASADDTPTIGGSWQSYIPAQGSYAYLWKKVTRWRWNATLKIYEAGNPQYYRLSGTNGTSIDIKGHVATVTDLPSVHSDGDAYVVDADRHLYIWSDEANRWLDIGQFQGENGKTYYTHIAWATNVVYSEQTGEVIRVDGFVIAKSPDDDTRYWMGVLVNEDSSTDSSAALDYTWSYTKGVDGFSVQAQYAPNNNPSSSQIHNTWQNGDIYMRTKQSNETTWSSWNKIVGENGGETDYSFNISKEKTSASATDAPSNCYYNTWQDAPISPTSTYPYLWMKIQKKDGDGNNVGDASYARVTGELGIDYEIRCAIDSIKIPKDTTSTSVSTTFNFYYKESGKTPIAYNAYYGIYYRIGTTYTRISSGSDSYASLSSYTVQSNQTAIVVFIFSASYSGNSPMSQSYLSKLELPIYKDGDKGDKGDDAKYIYIRGTGYNNDAQRILNITSTTNVFSEYGSRGFVAARINRSTLAVSGITWFDVYGGLSEGSWTESDANANTARTRFVTYLTNTTSDYFLAVASKDAIGFNDAMVVKLREFGLGELDYTAVSGVGGFRTPFAFLGYKGLQQGYALYQLHGEGENEPYAEVMAYVSNGIFMSSKDGKDGARGKVGRFFYFGGTFNPQDNDPTHVFVVNDAQAPYFEHTENGQKRYHVFNYETNGSYTMSQMWAISSNWNNNPWEVMTNDFKYIITEALFGAYAHLGSFIINGDWMISQYGVLVDSSGTETIVDGGGANPIVLYGNDVHGGTIIVRVQFTTSGTASITATASCESTYDKGYVKNTGGSTLIEASGTQSDTVNQSVSSGGYIDLSYTKDGSVSSNDDKITFNISGVGYTLSLVSATSGMTYTGSSSSGGVIPSNPHTYFDPTDPMASTKPSSGYKFRPNFAVDGLTGKTYQQNAHVKGTVTATGGSITGDLDVTGALNVDVTGGLNVKNSSNAIKVKINGGSVSKTGSEEITIVDAEGFYVKRGSEGFRLTATGGFQRWNSSANNGNGGWVNFYGGRYVRTVTAYVYTISLNDDFIIAKPSSSGSKMYLPSGTISDGKIIAVTNAGIYGIYIHGNGKTIQGAREYSEVVLNVNDRMEFIYSGDKWYANYMPKVDSDS